MKKTALLLALIYALSSTGIAIKADYCCEKLVSLKFILANEAKNKNGCCKVKFESFKVNDVHAAADIITTPAVHLAFPENLHHYFSSLKITSASNYLFINEHAPPPSLPPIYISNCVFRI